MDYIQLQIPIALTMGSKPLSQIAAVYHYTLTQGTYTQAKYASEWGWTEIETNIFINQIMSWHDSCNININIIAAVSDTTTTRNINNNINNNISGGGGENK